MEPFNIRLSVEISENSFDRDIINYVKQYQVPDFRFNFYFKDDIYERLTTCIFYNFRSSQLNLITNYVKLLYIFDSDEIR